MGALILIGGVLGVLWHWPVERSEFTLLQTAGDYVFVCRPNGEVEVSTGLTPIPAIAGKVLGQQAEAGQDSLSEKIARVAECGQPDKFSGTLILEGQPRWVEARISRLVDRSGAVRILFVGQDATLVKAAEEDLRYRTTHDALTNLANRQLFKEEMRDAVRQQQKFAILALDIDGFKKVNDSLGQVMGDELLQQTAGRMRAVLRGSDSIARIGGDEFAVIARGVGEAQAVQAVAQRLLNSVRRPFVIGGQTIYLTVSVGAALYPDDGEDVEQLLQGADTAMYRAKAQGRDRWARYEEGVRGSPDVSVGLEAAMHEAIENGEFSLHYQPVVCLATRRIVSAEALMRWTRGDGKIVSPAEFIPLAETNGLVSLLGAWALRTACQQAAQWRANGHGDLAVAVNISPRQFRQKSFARSVYSALEAACLPPGNLILEITEGILMQNPEEARELLKEFRAHGIRIAVDDFGTGYSSLAYLKRFPLSTLKIDRTFVKGLPDDTNDAAIVSAVLSLARELGLNVVAEGVESEAQSAFLASRHCPQVQGWLTGKPMQAEAFAERLEQAERAAA